MHSLINQAIFKEMELKLIKREPPFGRDTLVSGNYKETSWQK
jgi:hypothetical protein